jgi:hypothetical protein
MSSDIVEAPQAITPKRRSILSISDEQLSRLKTLAEMMSKSQYDYAKNGSKPLSTGDIFIKMLKGIEVGLEPIASLDLIDIIQGKPTLKPQGMLALAWGSGQVEALSITDDGNACKVTIKRQGVPAHTETFSADDAKSMGLANRDSWKKQPVNMRKWRAVSAACRVVFPDIIQGMYIPEEIAPETIAFDENGEVIQALPAPKQDDEAKALPPEQKSILASYHVYTIDGNQKYVEFTVDPDPELEFPRIRAYGRSTKLKGMLNRIDPKLYNDMGLGLYSGATETSKKWNYFEPSLLITYEVKDGYNNLVSVELPAIEVF